MHPPDPKVPPVTISPTSVPRLEMNDGHRISQLGFGVFKVPPERTAEAVLHALDTGYRAIDTAAAYDNEEGVADAITRSGLAREDVFVTTKVWNGDHGRDRARAGFERSLERLRSEYVDLYLIHWPQPAHDLYLETWETLIELRDSGRARSIGVSNFLPQHLDRIIDATGVTPSVNQIEVHPWLQQAELRASHAEHGILTEAWSPLARGGELLRDPAIEETAAAVGRTPAQVVLRWHVQIGNIVIPKSVTPSRIAENFRIFDFALEDDRMRAIAAREAGRRIGPDPATFGPTSASSR
jgi:2,5-diketo-D-gluconate reductase A